MVRHPGWFDARTDPTVGLLGRVARALAAGGVASFRYDPRGCGASGGSWEESGLFTRIDDARDAIGALRGRDELDLRRCGILGHGEGALVAMAVVIGDPVLSALTLVAPPARSFRDLLRRGAARRLGVRGAAPIRSSTRSTGRRRSSSSAPTVTRRRWPCGSPMARRCYRSVAGASCSTRPVRRSPRWCVAARPSSTARRHVGRSGRVPPDRGRSRQAETRRRGRSSPARTTTSRRQTMRRSRSSPTTSPGGSCHVTCPGPHRPRGGSAERLDSPA